MENPHFESILSGEQVLAVEHESVSKFHVQEFSKHE